MKYLYSILTLCFTLTAHAEALVEEVTFECDWQLDYMLAPGKYACPGGTLSFDTGMPFCDGGKGMHIRNTEIYSCMGASVPFDPRMEGTLWIQVNANLDSTYTGPAWGSFKAVPSGACDKASLINPSVYWEGSWVGKRELTSFDPMIWIETIEIVGHGVGGELEGLKIKATEVLTMFTPLSVPWEYLGIGLTGPESTIYSEIKSKTEK